MESNLPITNNNLLPFITAPTAAGTTREVRKGRRYTQEVDPDCQSCDSNTSSGERFQNLVELASECYMYLLIIGSIAFISGLLLSLISFYGLNTSQLSPIIGPLLLFSGTVSGLLGVYFSNVSKQKSEEILIRKSRYENFSEVFRPTSREEMFIISNRYQDTDIACFPSPLGLPQEETQNNIRIDVSNETEESRSDGEKEREDGEKLSPQQIEIPSSRRSSFHGDCLDLEFGRAGTGTSPLQLITVSPTRNKVSHHS